MKVLITGATGFIGANLALKLARDGIEVNALYRSETKAKILNHEKITLCKGNILDIESLRKAAEGCNQIYHVAAFTEAWAKNKKIIYDLNVEGTLNIFNVAEELNIKNIVFTSTAGVIGPSYKEAVNEETKRTTEYFIEYEKTKAIAEEHARKYSEKGLKVVTVCPTRVYGPGALNKSNSVTIMIKSFNNGKWRIIPGNGKSRGNYVYIDDVVNGHILAMEKGKAGEKYLLGGDNKNFSEFFNILKELTGRNHLMIKMPLLLMLIIAWSAIIINKFTGIKPFITPELVKKYNFNWEVSSQKAVDHLGYKISSLRDGMEKTLHWLNQ